MKLQMIIDYSPDECCSGELVRRCSPGDVVTVTGVYLAVCPLTRDAIGEDVCRLLTLLDFLL